jgi:anti-sigma B factor antagonist
MKLESPFASNLSAGSRGPKKTALSLEARSHSGTIVLHCQGRLIFHNEAHALAATVSEVLPIAQRMVVDLSGVDVIDSAGLGELVLLYMWADAAGYILKFCGAKRSVREILEFTNLTSILDLHPSVPDAITAMQSVEASH